MDIHPLLRKRWSPRSFLDQPVEIEKLARVFEAARSAPSCFNEQPWRFIVGTKPSQTYTSIWDGLSESNKVWTQLAPVLVAICYKKTFAFNKKPNQWAKYDAGQAAAYLTFQATEEGLFVHQMAGFEPDKLVQSFLIPDDFTVKTIMALGYMGPVELLPEALQKKEKVRSERQALDQMVYEGTWAQSASFSNK